MLSVSVGFMLHGSSPKFFTHTSTCFWHWIFGVSSMTSNTESCDEDDGEAGEGVVEEEIADKPGTTNGT